MIFRLLLLAATSSPMLANVSFWTFLAIFTVAFADVDNYVWRSVPLTTSAQAEAKIPGGEGFQQAMCIAYAPSNPRVVFMGTDTAKVWKSSDGGNTWKTASNGMDSNGARSLLIHPQDENIILAAGFLGPEVERARQSIGRREGVFRSTDGGVSWEFAYKTEFHKQRSIGSLFAVDMRTVDKKDLVVFAGSYNEGLLISRDTGRTWGKTDFSEGIIQDIETSPSEPGALFIATSKGLYRYKDGTAEKIGAGLPDVPSNIAVSPAAPNRIVAAVGGYGIYISNDNGYSFTRSSRGLPPAFLSTVVDVHASPIDASRLYAGTWKSRIKGPFYTDDGGASWRASESLNARGLTDGKGFYFPSPIAAHPQEPHVALAVSNGRERILRTTDGGRSWYYSGSGYTGARIVDMAFVTSKEWYLALTDYGLWKTEDGGMTFSNISIPGIHPHSIGAVAVSEKRIVLSIGGWRDQRLAISHDGGKSWKIVDAVTGFLRFIRVHPEKANVIYASSYRSNDGGKTWSALKYEVRSLFYKEGDVVYGYDGATSTVVESADMGSTWHNLAGCDMNDDEINEMAADPEKRGRLYLGTNGGFYRVDDGKCKRIGPELGFNRDTHAGISVQSVAVDPLSPRVIYAGRRAPGKGTSSGVYRSDNFGMTWSPYNNGISGSFDVWAVETNPGNALVYIGTTYGLHVLERRLPVSGP